MTLRDFKEVFYSKPCSYTVSIYCNFKHRVLKKYFVLLDFYDDDYCDTYKVISFEVHDGSINDIFICIGDE